MARWRTCFCGQRAMVRYQRTIRPAKNATGGLRRKTVYLCGLHGGQVDRMLQAALGMTEVSAQRTGAEPDSLVAAWEEVERRMRPTMIAARKAGVV